MDIVEELEDNGCDCHCRTKLELRAAAEIIVLRREVALLTGTLHQLKDEMQNALKMVWDTEGPDS